MSQHKSQKVKLTTVSELHHYDLQTLVPESKHLQYQFSTENQANKEQTRDSSKFFPYDNLWYYQKAELRNQLQFLLRILLFKYIHCGLHSCSPFHADGL